MLYMYVVCVRGLEEGVNLHVKGPIYTYPVLWGGDGSPAGLRFLGYKFPAVQLVDLFQVNLHAMYRHTVVPHMITLSRMLSINT